MSKITKDAHCVDDSRGFPKNLLAAPPLAGWTSIKLRQGSQMTRYLSLAFCGIFAVMCLVSSVLNPREVRMDLSLKSAPGDPEVPELSFLDGVKANEQIRDTASFGTTATDYGYDVLEYNLSGHFDWTRKILVAEIEITFQVSQPLREIVLDSRVGTFFERLMTWERIWIFKFIRSRAFVDFAPQSFICRRIEKNPYFL